MKKFAYLAFAFVMGVFTSCTDKEDIEIVHHHDLSLNINTQNLYDQFNLTYTVRETHLRDGGRCVGLMMYLYNSEGNLIQNKEAHLNNFNPATLKFDNLAEGKYTLITIETLLNPDDDYKADTWSFDDVDKISTLKISEKLKDPDEDGYRWSKVAIAPEVIGVSTQDIDLVNDLSIDVVPKGIGAVVEFNQFYWDRSSLATVGWATDHVLNYYRLNPALSRNDRFVKNLTSTDRTHVRGLYEVDVDPSTFYGAYVLESEIDWKCVYQSSEDIATGKVYYGNSKHAMLEDGQTYQIGCYNAGDGFYDYFGDESGLRNWKADLDNTVGPPSSTLFKEPYTNWNAGTVSSVKSYMANFTLTQDIQYDEDDKTYDMVFDVANNYTMYRYVFTSSTSGLTDAYVYLDGDSFTISQVRDEIVKQGYTYNSQNNNNYYYTGSSTYVRVYQSSSGLILVNYYNPSAYGLAPKFEIPMYPVDFGSKGIKGNDKKNFLSSANNSLLNPYVKKEIKKVLFK